MEKKQSNEYIKISLVLLLSICLILFTQGIKLLKNPASTPITFNTIIKVLADFPILGWVSLTSLFFCLLSDFFVQAIAGVDFLSITTPILAFAGLSVADSLMDLRKTSWRVAIVAVFVFIGTYLGSAIIAQIGLLLTGK